MPNYKRPPIIDAVIEIRHSTELTPKQIETVAKKLQPQYPFKKSNVQIETSMAVSDSGLLQQTMRSTNGLVLENTDLQSVATIMPKTFSVAARAPYPGWDVLFAALKNVWKIIKDISEFKTVTRIGSRFINRIDIPVQGDIEKLNIADYLKVGIQSPERYSINSYDVAFMVELENNFSALIRTTTTEPAIPLTAALLLDMDIYCTNNLPMREDELLNKVNFIREQKNNLFEGFVTDKSREIFNREVG